MSRLVYLLAASHSGSTLLGMLLGAQPGACTVGELKATSLGDPDLYRCSCRKLLKDCRFWSQVRDAMNERGCPDFEITRSGTGFMELDSPFARRFLAPLYRSPLLESLRDTALSLSPAWHRHLRETSRRNKALIDSVLGITGAEVIVDTSKQALRLKFLLRIPALEIRVVRVIRDGRAVSLTYVDEWAFADASDPHLRGGGSGEHRPSVRQSMADAANEWKRSNEAADCMLARLPRTHWTEVRYEELCADPAGILRRLATFLDLDPDQTLLDFRSRQQHVIGNGMRLDNTSEIKLDERWKNELSSVDLQVFDKVAGELNRKYGYAQNMQSSDPDSSIVLRNRVL